MIPNFDAVALSLIILLLLKSRLFRIFGRSFLLEHAAKIQNISPPCKKKEQNISPIKQRILLFAGTLGISKREFYSKIGVSRGTLESRTGITEDIITKFFATYPEVNIEWLMLGRGVMLKTKQASETNNDINPLKSENKDSEISQHSQQSKGDILDRLLNIISDKDSIIAQQAQEIGRLQERNHQLERRLQKDALDVPTSGIASAG